MNLQHSNKELSNQYAHMQIAQIKQLKKQEAINQKLQQGKLIIL